MANSIPSRLPSLPLLRSAVLRLGVASSAGVWLLTQSLPAGAQGDSFPSGGGPAYATDAQTKVDQATAFSELAEREPSLAWEFDFSPERGDIDFEHVEGAFGEHPTRERDAEPTTPKPSHKPAPEAQLPSADRSGVTGKTISVPKGEGTVKGMEESFSAQLSTGIATFNVPLALPQGRGDAQPSLGLAYTSSGGYDVAGVGWSVGVPFIARQTDKGLPQYDDRSDFHINQDRFVFNGGQELVPICVVRDNGSGTFSCANALGPLPDPRGEYYPSYAEAVVNEEMPPWAAGWQYFRPRVEGSFLRFFWSPDHRLWRVQDKSGVTMELGGTFDSLEVDPDVPTHIYRWHLSRQFDAHHASGADALTAPLNVAVYQYLQDGGMAYLSDVYYTPPVENTTSAPLTDYAHHVHLRYQQRTDVTQSYRSGWLISQRLRLAQVDVASKAFDGPISAARQMVRKYHLAYRQGQHASLLESVTVEGRCASTADSNAGVLEAGEVLPASNCPTLPPMRFGYGHVAGFSADGSPKAATLEGFEAIDERRFAFAQSPEHSLDDVATTLMDVNADSLPDVLVTAPGIFQGNHGVFFNGDQGQVGHMLADRIAVNGPASVGTIGLSNLNVVPLDVDGDASVDLLHMPLEKTYSVYSITRNNGRWQWLGRAIATADRLNPKIDLGKDAAFTRVVDVNFDGLVDVVRSTGTELQTFFALGRYPGGDGQFGQATWTSPTAAALSNQPVRACLPWSGTNLNFEDRDIQLADMNGDGIVDIVRVRRGEILYWPGRGNGYWGSAASPTANPDACKPSTGDSQHEVLMASSPTYSDVQGTTLRVDDVNGDGLSDLVQVRYDEVDVWLNVNGTSWTKRHTIGATPESPGFANTVRLTDVNGSGSVDILWGDAGRYQYIDLTGGIRPHLLTRVDNGLGKTTDLEYVSSANEMLAAARAGNPWSKTMATVSTLVKRVTERDHLTIAGRPPAAYVTEYTYRNPVFEGRQREFRGFEYAESRKIGDANSPTSISSSQFLLGECVDESDNGVDDCGLPERWRDNPREALKGLPIITETRDENGVVLSTLANQYTLRTLYTGLDGRLVRYAFQSGTTSWLYDTDRFVANTFGGNAPENGAPCAIGSPATNTACLPAVTVEANSAGAINSAVALTATVRQQANPGTVRIESADTVDWFGNQLAKVAYGQVGVDETITNVTLPTRPAGDATGWLWRTESSFVVGSEHAPGTSGANRRNETHITYSAVGDPLTTSGVLAGTVTLRRSTANPASAPVGSPGITAPETVLLSTTTYDDFGNPTRSQGANLRCSDVSYDAAYGYLPVTETTWTRGCDDGVALTTVASYDRGLAVLTDALNVQNQPTRVVYDGFGRVLQMFAPHPTTTGALSPLPSVEIEYFLPPVSGAAHSLIHTKAQDGTSIDDPNYLESWAYVDGLGRTITTLSEDEMVEVTTDNQTESVQRWIVGAMQEWDAKGAVRRKYLEFYYTGDPQTFDFGAHPGTYYGRQRYDAFGRQLQTYDLDGTVTLRSKYHALSSEAWDAADLEAGSHQSTYLTTVKDGHGRGKQSIERVKEGTTLVERSTETQFLPTGEPEVITRRKLMGGVPVSGASVSRWFAWDTLGRMVLNVEPNTSVNYAHNATPNVASSHETTYNNVTAWRYQYNLAGDLIGMSDARGCGANFYFDGVGRLLAEDYFPCSSEQAQYSAPTVDTLPSGDKLPTSTGTGVEVLYSYDAYVPPAQTGLSFDEACDPSTAPGALSLGRLVRVADLGAESYTVYDGRGRNTCATTRLTRPYTPVTTAPVPAFDDRYAPRWYAHQFTYDAADRVVEETTGARVLVNDQGQSYVKTVYSSRGTVKQVDGAYGDLIAAIDRTADGLVTRVEYADLPHTATTYTFDDRRRVHTAITARAPPSQWPADFETDSDGTYPLLLQDETFTYDVVGNPVAIADGRIPEEWPAGSKPVSRRFAYDDLYRVIKADYQYAAGDDAWKSPFEAELAATDGAGDPRRAKPSPHVEFAKRILWQSYQYDWLGNTRTSNDDAKGFYDRSLGTITNGTTKAYQLTGATNTALGNGADNVNRTGSLATVYDAAGNLVKLEVTRNGSCAGAANPGCHQSFLYSWDEVGRLVRARRWDQATLPADPATTTPAVDLQYHYAAGDSRVLKTARDINGAEVHTAYVFPSLELRRAEFDGDAPGDYTLDSSTEVAYLFANGVRLARLVHQPLDSAADGHLLRVFFELGDHLGSTSVALDKATGELVERSTYQAYGGAESSYRPSKWGDFREDYRFTGKEEDVEVGLTYFGKRFYNALLQRWVSADPLEVHEAASGGPNVYAYVSGSPLKNIDPIGLEVKLATDTPAPTPTAKIHTFEQGKSSQHTTVSRAQAQSAPSGRSSSGPQNAGDGFDPVADMANADAGKFGTATSSGDAKAPPLQDALIGAAFANLETPDAISTTPGVGDPGGIPGGFCTTNCVTGLGPQIGYLFLTVAAVATGGGKADDVVRAAKSVGETVARKAGEAVEATKAAVEELRSIRVSRSDFPQSAKHIQDAQAAGHPSSLTIDRAGASGRRRESLRGTETQPGMDRDEYPPAMFEEGGSGASVRHLPSSDNRGAGACIGAQCRGLPDGTKVNIDVVD